MNILLTGGAGYIGACTSLFILKLNPNFKCIIIDKEETQNIKKLQILFPNNIKFYKIDMCRMDLLETVFNDTKVDGVIHFAAYTIVSESEKEIYKYFHNNINSTLNLLELMKKYAVSNLIFSSSASVYGVAEYLPIDEDHPLKPVSTYAISKKICEDLILKYSERGINYVILRYFNPAGAIDGIGEEHNPETHLIPLLIRSMLEGNIFRIFGNDFPTPDGTCIRDFIHIEDLANAHFLSLRKLLSEEIKNEIFNVGINKGYSVMEVVLKAIEMFKEKVNKNFRYVIDNRREGDVPALVAKADKIKNRLGFYPKYTIEDILQSVWNYESQKIST